MPPTHLYLITGYLLQLLIETAAALQGTVERAITSVSTLPCSAPEERAGNIPQSPGLNIGSDFGTSK